MHFEHAFRTLYQVHYNNKYKHKITINRNLVFPNLVASSNMSMAGFFKIALAMAILCFCPPETVTPRSPTIVL